MTVAVPASMEESAPSAPPTAAAVAPAAASLPPPADGRAVRASPWVASTYFAEGLPYSIVHQIATQLFTAMGASLQATGLTSLYGLAWNLKFVWSPLVDRTATMRRWIVGLQLALGVLVLAMAVPAGSGDLGTVARLLVLVAVLAATQDVAIDGFYLRALGKNDQAALSGFRVAAYRASLLVGNGLLVALAGWVSWRAAFLAAGGILLVLAVAHLLFLPRPASDAPAPTAPGAHYLDALSTFVRQPEAASVLAFILLFRAGDALMFAMGTPLLKDLGLDTDTRGLVSGVAGTLASIVGSVIGGLIVARVSLPRALFPIAALQSAAIPLYALVAATRPGLPWVAAAVVAEQLVAGIGTAAFTVFILRRCAGAYKASHFAVATALMSVAATVAGSASGFLADALGFPVFFLLAFAASWPGVLLARRVPTV